MSAPAPTPWAVICPWHKRVFLTHDEYVEQLDNVNDIWRCTHLVDAESGLGRVPEVEPSATDEPKMRPCGLRSEWDDENYEMREGGEG
jgi:hypothetical protein